MTARTRNRIFLTRSQLTLLILPLVAAACGGPDGGGTQQRSYSAKTADFSHTLSFVHLEPGTEFECGKNTVEMQYQSLAAEGGGTTYGGRGAAQTCAITLTVDPALGYQGTYSGTLKTSDGSQSVELTDGKFKRVDPS